MNLSISTNTQAILLLTAPLITGKNGSGNGELLTHGEYRRYARQLRHLGLVPADLLGTKSAELLRELETVIPADTGRSGLDPQSSRSGVPQENEGPPQRRCTRGALWLRAANTA